MRRWLRSETLEHFLTAAQWSAQCLVGVAQWKKKGPLTPEEREGANAQLGFHFCELYRSLGCAWHGRWSSLAEVAAEPEAFCHWPKARRGTRKEGFGAFWPPRPDDAEEKEETSQDIEPYLCEALEEIVALREASPDRWVRHFRHQGRMEHLPRDCFEWTRTEACLRKRLVRIYRLLNTAWNIRFIPQGELERDPTLRGRMQRFPANCRFQALRARQSCPRLPFRGDVLMRFLKFDLEDDGSATLVRVSPFLVGDVTLPSHVDGYPVRAIGQHAFWDCVWVRSIILPPGVITLGWGAFRSCATLQSVVLPAALSKLEGYAFYHCERLREIDFPEGLTDLGPSPVFACANLATIRLPKSLRVIRNRTFYNCPDLKSIVFASEPPAWEIDNVPPRDEIARRCDNARGLYPAAFREAWEAVLDENGCWHTLPMQEADFEDALLSKH